MATAMVCNQLGHWSLNQDWVARWSSVKKEERWLVLVEQSAVFKVTLHATLLRWFVCPSPSSHDHIRVTELGLLTKALSSQDHIHET